MLSRPTSRALRLAALSVCLAASLAAVASQESPDEASLSSAVCPIVYQVDQSPSSHGYRYSFFGNGFFINEKGYVLTVSHVLENFRDGGQPYILLSRKNGPPSLLKATIIAQDPEHDVAILRAALNPFESSYKVAFLPLAPEPAIVGQAVLALSLHPPREQNAHTFDMPTEDRSSGQVISYETTQLEKNAPVADVFLLSHPVELGQSGSPVLAQKSHAVVGLVEGRWLRTSVVAIAKASGSSLTTPGAAVPIRYAIALLERESVSWHSAPLQPQSLPSSHR